MRNQTMEFLIKKGLHLKTAGRMFAFVLMLFFCTHSLLAQVEGETLSPDQFGSLLTLDDAIQRALKSQAEVKRALARLSKEESLYKGTLAEFFPKLKADAFGAVATGERRFVSYVDAGIEQPIFQGGKNLAQKRRQQTVVESEKKKLEQVRLDVELGVRIVYAQVLQEKELTRMAQEQVKELALEHERIKKLVDKEILPRYEFFRMETLLESAKHGLVKHKETYDYLLTVLKETIGIGEGESLDLEPLADFQELEESAAQYLDRARHHDPVYQLQELKVKEKQFEKRMLQADRFPKISFTAKWDQLRDVYANTNRGMVGIVGKWDIWDFGRLGSQIDAKSHEIEEMKWQGEIEIREHENAIRRIFHEARAAREKIKLTETLIQERQEIYKNEKTRLIAGEKGSQELVDSFVALEEAKTQRLQAITEYRILIVQLERKIGFEAHLEELNGSEDFDPSPNSREAES